MGRPSSAPLKRTLACVCGEQHAVIVVLMGAPVIGCPQIKGHTLHLEQNEDFPYTWYLRTGVRA